MHSSIRLSVAVMFFVLLTIAMMECSYANPNPEQHEGGNVADAIRFLQDLERIARPRPFYNSESRDDGSNINNALILEMFLEQLDKKHARTPRFGKRGNNEYLTKEYTNNALRYILQNPEFLQQQNES